MSKSDYGKAARSVGIGKSKIHAADAGQFEPNPILSCHIGGVLVAEMPLNIQHAITFAHTDEGIAQREEELRSKGRLADPNEPRIEFGRTEWDGELEGYGDAENPAASDPLKIAMDKHCTTGFAGKFMSKEAMKKFGSRGYRVVKDATGTPVERGNMVLGEIPKELRDKRKAKYAALDREQQAAPSRTFQSEQEQVFSQAGIPLAEARRAMSADAGLQDDTL